MVLRCVIARWKIFVFTHAPPMGAGLRVLQKNHVVNGCCWLNHSSGPITAKYIELVRANRSIKGWFSGHFHLGQDYEDSITFPAGNNRGSCVFVQTAVMRSGSTRDGRQQSRLVRGTKDGFEVCTVNHQKGGAVRLDASVNYDGDVVVAHPSEDYDHDKFFSAYTPSENDGCEIVDVGGTLLDDAGKDGVVCWWNMKCGRVLGVHEGMVVEYDKSTLAPLGLVIAKDELAGRKVTTGGGQGAVTKGVGLKQSGSGASGAAIREQCNSLFLQHAFHHSARCLDSLFARACVNGACVFDFLGGCRGQRP